MRKSEISDSSHLLLCLIINDIRLEFSVKAFIFDIFIKVYHQSHSVCGSRFYEIGYMRSAAAQFQTRVVFIFLTNIFAFSQEHEAIQATFSEILTNPMRYDKRVVRIDEYVMLASSNPSASRRIILVTRNEMDPNPGFDVYFWPFEIIPVRVIELGTD